MKQIVALAGLLLLGFNTAFAAEGRIPIFEPIEFNQASGAISGDYIVTRTIANTTAASTIKFVGTTGTEVVSLDLNGFAVSGGTSTAYVIHAYNLKSFTLRNGSVIGKTADQAGVVAALVSTVLVEDVQVQDTGDGISLNDAAVFRIRRCTIDTVSANGIRIDGGLDVTTIGVIEDNIVQNADFDGILVFRSINAVEVSRNRVFRSALAGNPVYRFGISIDGFLTAPRIGQVSVTGNTVVDSDAIGIGVNARGCLIADNIVNGSDGHGIEVSGFSGSFLSSDCQVLNNTSTENTGAGIFVTGKGNRLEGNVLNLNRLGLRFTPEGTDNSYGGNTATGNTSVADCPAPGTAPTGCALPDLCDQGTNNLSTGRNAMPPANASGPC